MADQCVVFSIDDINTDIYARWPIAIYLAVFNKIKEKKKIIYIIKSLIRKKLNMLNIQ